MLKSIYIENIAVIEKSSVSFENGFQVITGETGAGKSILVDSINFILGSRASRDIIRTGCDKAVVSAVFTDLPDSALGLVEDFGIDYEDELIIQRNFSSEGKNTARINGLPVTLSMLKDLGTHLINFHGQHENNNLLDSDFHLRYLDLFAGDEKERLDYAESYKKVRDLQKKLRAMNLDEKEKKIRTETLSFIIDDIDKASLKPAETGGETEEETLLKLRNILYNKERLKESVDRAWSLISEENGALLKIYESSKALSQMASLDSRLESLWKNIDRIYADLESFKDDFRDYRYDVLSENDNYNLDEVEERLSVFERLERKYNKTFGELLTYKEECERELEELKNSESRIEELKDELRGEIKTLRKKAETLTEIRKKAGKNLSEKIVSELSFLDMPSVKFECRISEAEPSEKGFDSAEFLISANPGEELRPISKIASGGELSRIMLGIKSVLSEAEEVPTLIFDEIDTGVSGKAAQKIALKLAQIAKHKQILVVTHLVQMAAMGDRHLLISKRTENGKTFTEVLPLDEKGRIEEIARILGGVDVTDAMRNTAAEMLRISESMKKNIT